MATRIVNDTPCAPDCKDLPVQCPDCGALECLCRPRFFAGQLLTEDDLNRLDHYIRGKHRLQNRNLHGWGVVNGLKVLCDPCGDENVKVTQGYAIDPCGNDIVVCCDASVNVCNLIKRCKDKLREQVECTPFSSSNNGCEELEEEWILAIRYCEQPSRGITALRGGGCETISECAPSAHCGGCGKSSCSECCNTGACSCNGGCAPGGCDCQPKSSARRTTPRGAPPECEPTLICEGFKFEVFKKPEVEERDPNSDDDENPLFEFGGALVEEFNCCAKGLIAAIPKPPGLPEPAVINANPQAWFQWCCRTRKSLIDYLSRNPTTNCDLLRKLHNLHCPDPGLAGTGFAGLIIDAVGIYALVLVEGLINCLCLAMLPPAPVPTHDPRVALASVTVRGPKCEVVSVCNWTDCRRIMTTWPNMCYWWSVLPIRDLIRGMLDDLCCSTLSLPQVREPNNDEQEPFDPASDGQNPVKYMNPQGMATVRLNPVYDNSEKIGASFDFLQPSIARGKQPLDAAAFVASISRLKQGGDKGDGLHRMEQLNLAPFLMLNTLGRPLANTAIDALPKEGILDMLDSPGVLQAIAGVFGAASSESTASADMEVINQRFEDLEKTIKAQQSKIAKLTPKTGGAKKASKKKKK